MSVSSLRCRVCGGERLSLYREVPGLEGHLFRFHACGDCGSVTEEAARVYNWPEPDVPPDDMPLSLKFHLEVGASLSFFAEAVTLLETVLPTDRRRLLDVGTAFGFLPSIAARRGWDVAGVEPSVTGVFGARMLDVPIVRGFLEESGLPRAAFDAVFSSEVLEHVPDQDGFIRTLGEHLAESGVLFLTTPNAEGLTSSPPEPEWAEILSPGSHVSILSPAGARMLLARNGFEDVRVIATGGDTGRKRLLLLAARRRGTLPARISPADAEAAARPVVLDYLNWVADWKEGRGEDDPLYLGALYRLVEEKVNAQARDAGAALARLDAALSGVGVTDELLAGVEPEGLDDYLRRVPAFAGVYEYFKGLHLLNTQADDEAAAERFELAERLLEIERGLGHFPREGWPQRARQQRELALARASGRLAPRARLRHLAERALPPGTARRRAAKAMLSRSGSLRRARKALD